MLTFISRRGNKELCSVDRTTEKKKGVESENHLRREQKQIPSQTDFRDEFLENEGKENVSGFHIIVLSVTVKPTLFTETE